MQVVFEERDPLTIQTGALIVPTSNQGDSPRWSSIGKAIDARLNGEVARLAAEAGFTGKQDSSLVVTTLGNLPARRVIFTGAGPDDSVATESLVVAAGAAVRAAQSQGATDVVLALSEPDWQIAPGDAIASLTLGANLAAYRFDRYRGAATPNGARGKAIDSAAVCVPGIARDAARQAIARGEAIGRAVSLARDLVNEPASVLNPEHFAAQAREVAERSGLEIEILGPDELAALGANAILAVGGGSLSGPRLIRLRYQPDEATGNTRVPGLVGKAITFDTGGYSIKPYEGMLEMKGDMAGGAAVLGAMSALRDLACPIPVLATICAAENMISGSAFRPGDVITGMNDVTMEILSTDAEGRLVLADGLVDTARRGATEMIDLATLTGAAVVALGNGTTALFASDDALAENLLRASAEVGERMWRMPLIDALEAKIKGEVGDIKNTGGRAGGAITAALFLQHFTEGLPWAHLDIAGSARQDKPGASGPRGATGVGVRTLLRYLTDEHAKSAPAPN